MRDNRKVFYVEIKKTIRDRAARYCKKHDITQVQLAEMALTKFMREYPKFSYETIKL